MQPQAQEQSLRQKLNSMFNRYHFVGIKNITKEQFKWTVALEQNEILDMAEADSLSEQQMAKQGGGSFLPGDAATKRPGKLVEYSLAPGEKKMIPGEAAFVLIPRLINFSIREKYGSDKQGLSKFSIPSFRDEMLDQILVGPIVRDVAEVMNEVVGKLQSNITQDGFNAVEADMPDASMKDLRAEAAKRNITVPFGATKPQLVELLNGQTQNA